MAIVITGLGAIANNGTSYNMLHGFLSYSKDNWLFIATAADDPITFVESDEGQFVELLRSDYSGNVTTQLWGRKVYIGQSDVYIEVGSEVLGAKTCSCYEVTNLSGIGIDMPDVGDGGGSYPLNTTYKRQANAFWAAPCTITSVTLYLNKVGSPTGTLYVRIRYVDGDGIIGTLGSLDVSTLTTSTLPYTFNSSSAEIAQPCYVFLSVEYAAATSGNYVQVDDGAKSGSGNTHYRYTTSWALLESEKPVRYSSFTGADYLAPVDKTSTATGTNPPYNTGSTGTLSQADELGIAVIGIEEEIDQLGSWTTGAGYVSGNEQSAGTDNGGAKSISIATAAEVLSATTAQEGDMNAGSPDYAALIVTSKGIHSLVPVAMIRKLTHLLGR